jgi:drug/metabolite transporter (DMT)-like permease
MWVRLPDILPRWQPAPMTRAALWMLLSGLCAVLMNVLIRLTAQRMHPFEVTFFRCLFGFAVMLPFIIRAGPALFHNSRAVFFTLRAAVGLASMLTWFYGITLVPLATATAVNFTAPLFATIGAALILHEDVRLRRWSAVAIGFAGVLVIIRPGTDRLDFNLLLILVSAASAAMNNITVDVACSVVTNMVYHIDAITVNDLRMSLHVVLPCDIKCRGFPWISAQCLHVVATRLRHVAAIGI